MLIDASWLSVLLSAVTGLAAGAAVEPLQLPVAPGSSQPSVAVDPGRGFIVSWQTRDHGGVRLHYATLDRSGRVGERGVIASAAPSTADGSAAPWFVNWADFPSLVVLDNGDWVTYWLQKTASATYAYAIQLTRSTDRGCSWAPAIVPHADDSPTQHGFVSLVPAGADRVRVLWIDGRAGASAAATDAHAHHADGAAHAPMALREAVLDRRGRLGPDRVLDPRVCSCCQTDAARGKARTLVVYRNESDGDLRNVHWLAHDGRAWSTDQALHDDGWRIAGCPVNGPALASAGTRFVAAWTTQQDGVLRVRAARSAGHGFGHVVELDAGPGVLGRVDVAAWVGGSWLALWLGAGDQPGQTTLKLAELSEDLGIERVQALATLPAGRATGVPRLAAEGGVALAVWVDISAGNPQVRAVRIAAPTSSAMRKASG